MWAAGWVTYKDQDRFVEYDTIPSGTPEDRGGRRYTLKRFNFLQSWDKSSNYFSLGIKEKDDTWMPQELGGDLALFPWTVWKPVGGSKPLPIPTPSVQKQSHGKKIVTCV